MAIGGSVLQMTCSYGEHGVHEKGSCFGDIKDEGCDGKSVFGSSIDDTHIVHEVVQEEEVVVGVVWDVRG